MRLSIWRHIQKSRRQGAAVYSYKPQALKAGGALPRSTPAAPLEFTPQAHLAGGAYTLLSDCRAFTSSKLKEVQRTDKRTVFIHINGEFSGQGRGDFPPGYRVIGELTIDPRGKVRPAEYSFRWASDRSEAGDAWPFVVFNQRGAFALAPL